METSNGNPKKIDDFAYRKYLYTNSPWKTVDTGSFDGEKNVADFSLSDVLEMVDSTTVKRVGEILNDEKKSK